MKLIKINKTTKETIEEYEIRDNEHIVIELNWLYIMSDEEYDNYLNADCDADEIDLMKVPFSQDNNEFFSIKR